MRFGGALCSTLYSLLCIPHGRIESLYSRVDSGRFQSERHPNTWPRILPLPNRSWTESMAFQANAALSARHHGVRLTTSVLFINLIDVLRIYHHWAARERSSPSERKGERDANRAVKATVNWFHWNRPECALPNGSTAFRCSLIDFVWNGKMRAISSKCHKTEQEDVQLEVCCLKFAAVQCSIDAAHRLSRSLSMVKSKPPRRTSPSCWER